MSSSLRSISGGQRSSSPQLPNLQGFLRQLLHMVEDTSCPLIFWSRCGQFVIIDGEDEFFEGVCKNMFKQKSLTSFNKQMNNWLWRRVVPRQVQELRESDATIPSDNTRVWQHPTLTRDSTEPDIKAVVRKPDGMSKKKLLNGSGNGARRGRGRTSSTKRQKRRRDFESEAEETEEESFAKEESEGPPPPSPLRRTPRRLVTSTSTSTSARPVATAIASLDQPPTPARIPHVYYDPIPPSDDDLPPAPEVAAPRRRRRLPLAPLRGQQNDTTTAVRSVHTPQLPSPPLSAHPVVENRRSSLDYASTVSMSPETTFATPPIASVDCGGDWSPLFQQGGTHWWQDTQPFLESSVTTSPFSIDQIVYGTDPGVSDPALWQTLAPALEQATTTSSTIFEPFSTLLPSLPLSQPNAFGRTPSFTSHSPGATVAQRRGRKSHPSLVSLGDPARPDDQNTPTRATFGSSTDLLDGTTLPTVTIGSRRALKAEGSGDRSAWTNPFSFRDDNC